MNEQTAYRELKVYIGYLVFFWAVLLMVLLSGPFIRSGMEAIGLGLFVYILPIGLVGIVGCLIRGSTLSKKDIDPHKRKVALVAVSVSPSA